MRSCRAELPAAPGAWLRRRRRGGLQKRDFPRPAAQVADQAALAQRPLRLADVAPVQDEPMMRVQLEFCRRDRIELGFDLQWVLSGSKPGPVAHAEDMRVHRDGGLAEGDI